MTRQQTQLGLVLLCVASCDGQTSCASGEYSTTGGPPCTACPAGQYQQGEQYPNECKACGVGRYSATLAASCIDCPPGRFEPVPGQGGCRGNCDRGQSSVAGTALQSGCTPCSAGAYNTQVAGVCISCAMGRYSLSGIGQTSSGVCIACAAGTYSSAGPGQINASVCIACAAGTYSLAGVGATGPPPPEPP
eukprot:SAG25_NODE_2873_length_1340_cov_1.448026_2_plen_190_part_01